MKKRMKKVMAALMAVAVIMVGTGCADKGSDTASAGDTLKFAVSAEPDNLNPMMSAASDTGGIMMNVYEGLLTYDTDGYFLPCLAEGYEISEDGLEYSFKLQTGIKFHNGEDFSAEDVKYTYEKLAGLDGGEPLSQTFADVIESVETPDEENVVIRLKHVDAGFLCRCVIAIQEKDYQDDSTNPVGTGPYMFDEYVQGQKVVLTKNPDYKTVESRIPEVEKVEFRIMTDPNAVLMALKSGDLDVAAIDAAQVDVIGDKFEIVEGLRNTVQLMALNNTVEPFNDVRVRQAVNYAVNKEEIINTIVKGHGQRVDSFLSPRMPFFYNDEMTTYETDIEKAKELLKEAGYPDGFKMTITVPSNYKIHVDAAQVIKSQLEKVGIIADIQLVEWAQWLDQVYTKADYQASIVGHSGKLDPQDFLNRFQSTYAKNYFKFNDPAYDQLIVDAASTTDPDERAAIYKECQQMLVDQAAAVYIQDPFMIYAVNKAYENVEIYPMTFFDIGSVRMAE